MLSLLLSSPGSWCSQVFACPLWEWSLSPTVLWKSRNQISLAFRVRFPGDSQALCWIRRPGSLTWVLDPSQQWENFVIVLFSSLLVSQLAGMEFIFIVLERLLTSHYNFFFVFGHGMSFWVDSRDLLWMVFNSYLRFQCSYRRWVHVLLLCHLVPEAKPKLWYWTIWNTVKHLMHTHHILAEIWTGGSLLQTCMFFIFK